jgi:hypothetical protein
MAKDTRVSCRHCGEPLAPSPKGIGRGKGARYCDAACRTAGQDFEQLDAINAAAPAVKRVDGPVIHPRRCKCGQC